MKLSKQTIDVLKNFAAVNQNMLFAPGHVISTRTVTKNIFVSATVDAEFDREFGIYNLSEFLGIVGLFSEPEFEFTDKTVVISQGKNRVVYAFAEKEVLDYPDKAIKMPTIDTEFEMSDENLKSLQKAGAILGATDLLVSGKDGTISCTVLDPKNPTSNTFSIDVGTTDQEFSAYIKLENLKMPSGMYDVKMSSKKIVQFASKTTDYSMYIACEKNTTWN
jgi:hypothetical protein